MRIFLRLISILLIAAVIWGLVTLTIDGSADESPIRQTEIIVPYTEYEWWLIRWSTNQPECIIITDHEGLPNGDDIYVYCGNSLYAEWFSTEACPEAVTEEGSTATCKGLYAHQVASEPKEKTVLVDLPPAEAWFKLNGCNPIPPENRCDELPSLLITAEEPLPNEYITQIQGTINDIPFVCENTNCIVPLRPTPEDGVEIEFWADSSFGDSSEHYKALIRLIDGGVSTKPASGGWYVDVMGAQWRGESIGSCAETWNAFPPVGWPPDWLASPEWPELMGSDEPYTYLAGRLIAQGIVDASQCPSGGLEENGYANTCGLETARPEVDLWQDRFDAQIVEVARETGVPAQLMKNLFAQESQFWPGVFKDAEEYGLGQLTEMGADTVLLWNQSFFFQFCPLVLEAGACDLGYAQLSEEYQAILRGAVALQANSDCPDCPAGIDLNHADFSIQLFAQTLQANCAQTGQIVSNARDAIPGVASNFEDLWRFTLVNYHAGPGCLSNVIKEIPTDIYLTWPNTVEEFDEQCPGVVEYVEKIAH